MEHGSSGTSQREERRRNQAWWLSLGLSYGLSCVCVLTAYWAMGWLPSDWESLFATSHQHTPHDISGCEHLYVDVGIPAADTIDAFLSFSPGLLEVARKQRAQIANRGSSARLVTRVFDSMHPRVLDHDYGTLDPQRPRS